LPDQQARRRRRRARAAARAANVILRAVPDGAWVLAGRDAAPLSAVALDLATYPDPRSRRVGQQLLAALDQHAQGQP
jgi:GNAT superfamily N-acetyltransferase